MSSDVASPRSRHSQPVKVKHRDKGDVSGEVALTTTDDMTLNVQASSGSVSVQTSSERRCNGRVVTSTTSATDNERPVDVILKKKKRKRTKPEGWFIVRSRTCHS